MKRQSEATATRDSERVAGRAIRAFSPSSHDRSRRAIKKSRFGLETSGPLPRSARSDLARDSPKPVDFKARVDRLDDRACCPARVIKLGKCELRSRFDGRRCSRASMRNK